MGDFDGAALLDGKVADLLALGFDVGAATGDVVFAGAGVYRQHEYALVCAHEVHGAHEVNGLILDHYVNVLGGPEGGWGFPQSDEYADGEDGRSSDFEGGTLFWTAEYGVLEIYASPAEQTAPDVDWTTTSGASRLAYAVRTLVDRYGYPVNGAAGIVGNLWAESGVLPSRIEGSASTSPLRAKDFDGNVVDFEAQDVMDRDPDARSGPRLPGVGLAQWTSSARRARLFSYEYDGVVLGAAVLFSMDAQLDYLASELRNSYPGVNATVAAADVTLEAATDDIVYRFEVPGAILSGGAKLPREDARVQAVFNERRSYAVRALQAYQSV
ncbi:phage tail tip lysozyme [Kribbella sp. NPDC055110]